MALLLRTWARLTVFLLMVSVSMARGRCGPGDEMRFGNMLLYVHQAATCADVMDDDRCYLVIGYMSHTLLRVTPPAAHRPDRRGPPPLGGALGGGAVAGDGGRDVAHARPAGPHGAPERPAAPARADLPALRGADAAVLHARGRAAAGQDRRAPAGPPHVGDQHHRQARGRRARAPRAPRRGPARDAGRDHRRGPRHRQGGHRGAQRRVLRHRVARRRATSSASPTILRGLRLDAGDFTP